MNKNDYKKENFPDVCNTKIAEVIYEFISFSKGSNPVFSEIKSIYKREDFIRQGFCVFGCRRFN